MPLPIIETPKYETKLPSTGKKVFYRPYLVKEEKMLMIALESSDSKQIMQAVKDTISAFLGMKIPGSISILFMRTFWCFFWNLNIPAIISSRSIV